MPTGQTSTDIEQNGRDTNILSWYLDGNPALEPIENYGRLGKLLYLLVTSLLNGTVFRYGGRVDSVEDLPEAGTPNEFYFVGPEDSENYDEYIWVVNEEEEHGGHWDRIGSVSITIDDHLDTQSSNPVQNSVITLALNGLTVCLAAGYDTAGSYVVGSYCTRGQTLYKSKAVQDPAGEWDSSKWDVVTVMGELTSAIAGLATVARTGDYADLLNKPTIPTVDDRLKSSAVAAEYNSSTTYSDGDRFTFEGELYEVDSTASYLRGPDLITAASFDSTNGYLSNEQIKTNGDTYGRWSARTIGYTPVEANKTYVFDYKRYGSMSSSAAIEFSNSNKTALSRISAGASDRTSTQFTTPANTAYVRMACGYESIEQSPRAELYELHTDMPKVRKITVDSTKQDALTFDSTPTAGSRNPVTSDGINTALASKADTSAIPTVSDRLKSIAAASAFDPSGTYSTGDYMTQDGELYRCDPSGSSPFPNLFDATAAKTGTGYQNDTCYWGTGTQSNSASYITSNIAITGGVSYVLKLYTNWWTTANIKSAAFFNSNNVEVGTRLEFNIESGIDTINFTAPSTAAYIRLCVSKSGESSTDLRQVSTAKFVKTTVGDELGTKQDTLTFDSAPTANSNNPVTSGGLKTAFDDVYEAIKEAQETIIYGFHVDPNESDPKEAVTYLKDAVGMNPASMGSTKFDWGSWKGAFFMPKPCMLKFDGTVDYYLDPNDYSKKLDGTASDVATSTTANAMMEWPKIYFKFEAGELDGEVNFYCSNKKVDETYNCWCNYDANDNVIDHFYTSIYNGIIADSKMRSLSGYRLTPAIGTIAAYDNTKIYTVGSLCKVDSTAYNCITAVTTAEDFDSSKWEEIALSNNGGTTGQAEVDAATANNTTVTVEWYTDVFSDRELISALLILMSKCMDDQAAYGRGLDSGSQAAAEAYVTGTLNNKGLFYGVTANGNSAVKVFGMENWYGCKWRRTAGLVGGSNNAYLYKLTYGTADGSTANGYNSSGSNYLTAANVTRPGTNNYVTKMGAGKHGILPKETDAVSSSLYYGVYYYNGTGYALFGGSSGNGLTVGSLAVNLYNGFSHVHWHFAASLSCKPKKAV